MASPYIEYDRLVALGTTGGYNATPYLNQISSVFLLSACLVMRQKWLWQTPIQPLTVSQYQQIIELIEQAESDLMTSQAIGSIIPSVANLALDDSYIALDGSIIDGNDYPELLAVVPAIWITGTDITLPDMMDTGLFGENANVGSIIGENAVTLAIGELPSHTHTQQPHSHTEIIPAVTPALGGEIPATASLVVASPSVTGTTVAINDATGSDQAHNNIQQSLTVYWFIKAR